MSGSEQRAHQRIGVNDEFEAIDQVINEYVANLSLGGVFIRSRSPLPIGTKVQLCFTIVIDDVETIEGEGEVVRTTDKPVSGMAVSFTALSPRSEELIRRLVERQGGNKLVAVLEG